MIRNNQNRRRRGGNNNGPRPQQMGGGNNYGNRLDNRQRGNASQLLEKYRALARDAQQAGDRVTAEYYLQYADHYYRVLGDYRDKAPDQNRARRDNFDDDSAGYNGGNDDADGDDEDDGDDRVEARADETPRSDSQREDRGNWRDDRPNNNRDRNFRDSNRDQPRRDAESNGDRNRDRPREAGQGEFRRDGGNRDRQGWNGDRNRDGNDRGAEAPRNADRSAERNNDRRPERRPDPVRPAIADVADEGPIPGLPGPATLRLKRSEAEASAPRAERAPRVRPEPSSVEVPVVSEGVEAEAPKRRGRPRKLVGEAVAEG